MNQKEALDILENYLKNAYYQWNSDSNYSDYDLDNEMTREKMEILISHMRNGFIDEIDQSFIRELMQDPEVPDKYRKALEIFEEE